MPQLILDYTTGITLDVPKTLLALHRILDGSGQFATRDIKSRARCHEHWLTGVEAGEGPFVHLQLLLLDGRDLATREALSQALLPVLQAHCQGPQGTQLCVEVREMVRAAYSKAVL